MYTISKLLLNSLYGRFGMDYQLEESIIINNDELYKMIDLNNISDIIALSDDKSLITYLDQTKLENIRLSNYSSYNIDIGISSVITSYSRIFMSHFKNNPDLTGNLYYTDTDSLFIDKELPNSFINSEIGNFKLENIYKEICFLSPKVYGGITINGKEIIKIKGYKNIIPFNQLKSLLMKNKSLNLYQDKWFRSLVDANIIIENVNYKIRPTNVKRQLNYNNGRLISTSNLDVSD